MAPVAGVVATYEDLLAVPDHLVAETLVPDLAGWRRERLPEVPDVAFFELAPDWVCEVLSPSTAAMDRTRKWHHHARAGVSPLWFVDAGPGLLEVYRLEAGAWRLVASHAGDERVRAAPFEAIDVELGALWGR